MESINVCKDKKARNPPSRKPRKPWKPRETRIPAEKSSRISLDIQDQRTIYLDAMDKSAASAVDVERVLAVVTLQYVFGEGHSCLMISVRVRLASIRRQMRGAGD